MRVKDQKLSRIIFIGISVLAISLLLIGFKSAFNPTNENDQIEKNNSLQVNTPILPETLTFCGEEVPLNHFDVHERLEREITVNTYWHSQTIFFLKRANRFFPTIEKILRENNVPDDFKYLAVAESGLMNVVSPSGAEGFWQILEGTAKEYGLEVNDEVDERYHLEKATVAASEYLKDSYRKYNNWTLTAASYNAGRAGINRQISRQGQSNYYDLLFGEETSRYIFRILAIKIILENPELYSFHLTPSELYKPFKYKEEKITGSVSSFADFASEHNTNYKMLKLLNPWLRDNKLTNSRKRTYVVKIPRSKDRSIKN